MKTFLLGIALCLSVAVSYGQQEQKLEKASIIGMNVATLDNVSLASPLSTPATMTLALGSEDVVAFTFTVVPSTEKAEMFRAEWQAEGDGTYTYYYKEYETVYCGICPGGTLRAPTGRCSSSASGSNSYSCTGGM